MSMGSLFETFVEKSPVTVMVRSTLQYVFSPENIDAIFADAAVRQRPSELLFSSTVDLLGMVVLRQRRSLGQAYRIAKDEFAVSLRSVYNKLNGAETQVCRQLVTRTASPLVKVVDALRTGRAPTLRGYRTRIIDGSHLPATQHRLKVTRDTNGGPLPGQALAVLDPDRMLIVDVFPCEDAHAQERRMLGNVVESARPRDLWIADRNFCTTKFLFGLAQRDASFLIRQHKSTLAWDQETRPKKTGRCATGVVFEQQLHLENGDGMLLVRRITIKLDKRTRKGDAEIHLLTNLPRRAATAARIANLYLNRWTIENAFQELEQSLRGEINTLGYPGAALLGFSIAVVAYNALSLVKAAVEKEHAPNISREQLSGYYMAAIVSQDHGGMLIALPETFWRKRFSRLTPRQFASHLRVCATHVAIDAFRKNRRGPKKPKPKRTSGKTDHHVSTARLRAAQK